MSDSVGLEWGLRISISKMFPGDVKLLSPALRTTGIECRACVKDGACELGLHMKKDAQQRSLYFTGRVEPL